MAKKFDENESLCDSFGEIEITKVVAHKKCNAPSPNSFYHCETNIGNMSIISPTEVKVGKLAVRYIDPALGRLMTL